MARTSFLSRGEYIPTMATAVSCLERIAAASLFNSPSSICHPHSAFRYTDAVPTRQTYIANDRAINLKAAFKNGYVTLSDGSKNRREVNEGRAFLKHDGYQ
jgi:hypothetical protein